MVTLCFRTFCFVVLLALASAANAQDVTQPSESTAEHDVGWLSRQWNSATSNVHDIVQNGGWDVYLPVRTVHMPYAYTYEERHFYNSSPWGLGIGRGKYLDNGDWHGLYAIEFKDSKRYPSYSAGYMYKALWGEKNGFYAGVGASVFVMTRHDFHHYLPFPGIIPVATLGFRNVSIEATWVPGFSQKGVGDVMLIWLKFEEKSRPRL